MYPVDIYLISKLYSHKIFLHLSHSYLYYQYTEYPTGYYSLHPHPRGRESKVKGEKWGKRRRFRIDLKKLRRRFREGFKGSDRQCMVVKLRMDDFERRLCAQIH